MFLPQLTIYVVQSLCARKRLVQRNYREHDISMTLTSLISVCKLVSTTVAEEKDIFLSVAALISGIKWTNDFMDYLC